MVSILMSKLTFPYHPYHPYPPLSPLSPLSPLITLILLIPPYPPWEHFSLCLLFSYGVLPPSKSGADKHHIDFLRISWISDGFPWIWTGFSMEFMDLEWISMDLECMEFCLRPKAVQINLAWIFYAFHESRVDFHSPFGVPNQEMIRGNKE